MLTSVTAREAVHLLLLQSIASLGDEGYAIKGGVNLRFFFGSLRYSEDMDMDADPTISDRLKDRIRSFFTDVAVARRLRELGIRTLDPGEGPNKDTETTFRFKFGIVMPGDVRHPTKIEVSFRPGFEDDEVVREPVLPSIAHAYSTLQPNAVISHYSRTSATRQKILALSRRGVVQSRDIFDLRFLLADRIDQVDKSKLRESISRDDLLRASSRTVETPYSEYSGQVIEFLAPDDRSTYEGETVWDAMRLRVLDFLEDLAK
jgi:predicted nucleotidyltransferase component of viral defense system